MGGLKVLDTLATTVLYGTALYRTKPYIAGELGSQGVRHPGGKKMATAPQT